MEVKSHTSKKHRALGYYFSICRDVLKGSGSPKTLYYVDLFCGDGTSEDEASAKVSAAQHTHRPGILMLGGLCK